MSKNPKYNYNLYSIKKIYQNLIKNFKIEFRKINIDNKIKKKN